MKTNQSVKRKYTPWKKVGVIGVDAGLCWIGDPCYCVTPDANQHPAETWLDFCHKLDFSEGEMTKQWNYKLGHPGLGVSVSTGYGDGTYDVEARFETASGRCAGVRVKFI